jgi:hypothetical protein
MPTRFLSRPPGESIAASPKASMVIGRLVHELVGEVVSEGVNRGPVEDLREFVWTRTAELATSKAFGRAVRSARVAISGHVAVYLRRFAPPAGWSLLGSEIDLVGSEPPIGCREQTERGPPLLPYSGRAGDPSK